MKQPYIQFYVGDWIKDPELSMCSPSTRGIWIDLICRIHELNRDGKITANLRQITCLCRCTDKEALDALEELKTTGTAEVYESDGMFSVTCKRIRRAKELSEIRQQAGSKGAASTQAKREQNPDIDNEDGIKRVREFAREEGISEKDADWFYWKGKGNGWTNGGKPIRDWRATLRSWNRAGYLPSQKQSSNGQGQMRYQIPKERAPTGPAYQPVEFGPELTDEQIEKNKAVIEREMTALREKFKMPA